MKVFTNKEMGEAVDRMNFDPERSLAISRSVRDGIFR